MLFSRFVILSKNALPFLAFFIFYMYTIPIFGNPSNEVIIMAKRGMSRPDIDRNKPLRDAVGPVQHIQGDTKFTKGNKSPASEE